MGLISEIANSVERAVDSRVHYISGVLHAYDRYTNTAAVRAPNPKGEGEVVLQNLALPHPGPGLFHGAPEVGSVVDIVCFRGDLTHAQIVSIKPPAQNYPRVMDSLAHRDLFVPGLASRALK